MLSVGDRVRIVSEPYLECPFGWIDEMDRYTGEYATIVRIVSTSKGVAYRIDVDGNMYSWCENCFEHFENLIDFDVASDEEIDCLFGCLVDC